MKINKPSLSVLTEEVLDLGHTSTLNAETFLGIVQKFLHENTAEVDQMIDENVFLFYDKEAYTADSSSDIKEYYVEIVKEVIQDVIQKYPQSIKLILDKYPVDSVNPDNETMLDILMEICELPESQKMYVEYLFDYDLIKFRGYGDSDWEDYDFPNDED